MHIADRVTQLPEYPFVTISRTIAAKRAQGIDVISFGIGRNNPEPVEAELFASPTWDDVPVAGELRALARGQLGTVGSGNHYVDVFVDGGGAVWVGVHFGSRGLGHKLATQNNGL